MSREPALVPAFATDLKQPREWFAAACQRAAVGNYTCDANRHTFISRLIMAGVSLRTVQELAGHKTTVSRQNINWTPCAFWMVGGTKPGSKVPPELPPGI